jgi:hypothetical protein
MAKAQDKNGPQGSQVQGDFANFSGFEEKCDSGKGGKKKVGK